MKHYASSRFWDCYRSLPGETRTRADESFALLRENPRHPSLHLKRIASLWSVRVGLHYRALGTEVEDGILWVWIGSHADYDRLVR